MDKLNHYRAVIQQVLAIYAAIPYPYGEVRSEVIADTLGDHYLWFYDGWNGPKRIHMCLAHLDIIDDKIWIQHDGTERGLALDLEAAGIPKDQIVLAFQEPGARQYTEYAVA